MNKDFQHSLAGAEIAKTALEDKKAQDISVLDIHEISVIADCFVIATGSNTSQMQAMADEVSKKLFDAGFKLNHMEGYQAATWILLDFGSILVHLFNSESREFYNLERLWGDATALENKKE